MFQKESEPTHVGGNPATAQTNDLQEVGTHDTPPSFSQMLERLGIRPRIFYPVKTVAAVLGVPASTIVDEIHAGRMRYHLPQGRKQGRMIRPEWVDEWIEEGTHEGF